MYLAEFLVENGVYQRARRAENICHELWDPQARKIAESIPRQTDNFSYLRSILKSNLGHGPRAFTH